jgi:hypothetical protein
MATLECKNCHEPVGDGPKIMPMRVDGGNDDWEIFCPQCFVFVRAALEPLRFSGRYAAVHCSGCGFDSIANGIMRCGYCARRTALIILTARSEMPPEHLPDQSLPLPEHIPDQSLPGPEDLPDQALPGHLPDQALPSDRFVTGEDLKRAKRR